ncbi:hypothetical protein TNCV_1180431 [Trichonephila clavipes]|nr:hypothetical protein TNCV_1180431 [Trichonephila clavipes]
MFSAVSEKAAIKATVQTVHAAPDVIAWPGRYFDLLQTSLFPDSRFVIWLYDPARPTEQHVCPLGGLLMVAVVLKNTHIDPSTQTTPFAMVPNWIDVDDGLAQRHVLRRVTYACIVLVTTYECCTYMATSSIRICGTP